MVRNQGAKGAYGAKSAYGAKGAYGAKRAYGAKGACSVVLCLVLSACSYMPAQKERTHVIEMLQVLDGVMQLTVGCEGGVFASDGLCADILMSDRTTLRFENVGYKSFGGPAVNVFLAEAGGLMPRVRSCSTIGPPNIHRSAILGHHFSPTIIDVSRAVSRHRELLEEVHYWPQCPQFWEVQDKSGVDYRYCARKKDAADEPPKPANCQ